MSLAAKLHAIYVDNITAFERDYPELAGAIRQFVMDTLEGCAKHAQSATINVNIAASTAIMAVNGHSGMTVSARLYVQHFCRSLEGDGVYVYEPGPVGGGETIAIAWPYRVPQSDTSGAAPEGSTDDPTGRGARAITTLDDIVNDILAEFDADFLIKHGGLPANWRDDPETEARLLVRALINCD
jgi:hypothetical protein